MSRAKYEIVAFPAGERTVVATLWGLDANGEAQVALAAHIAGVSPGTEAEGMVNKATQTAALRGEYVDLYRDGEHLAVVGPEGAVSYGDAQEGNADREANAQYERDMIRRFGEIR